MFEFLRKKKQQKVFDPNKQVIHLTQLGPPSALVYLSTDKNAEPENLGKAFFLRQDKRLDLVRYVAHAKKKKGYTMKAEDLDKIFDAGNEDITPYLDLSTARRINLKQPRINVDKNVE